MRTRFAPSPTGYLHIGGVRTALFNWLLARRHNGKFVLRIDDTDAERNRAEAVKPILDGFRWLGVDWDEGPTADGTASTGPHAPYFQGQRNDKYEAAAMTLLRAGLAYPDYTTGDQQDAARKAHERARKPYVHRGTNRDVPADENVRQYAANKAPLLLKVEPGRTVSFTDAVAGKQDIGTDTIRDPALLRAPAADGVARALYNFATVVDEADFEISHVVRAKEHLSNTPTQILIYQALGVPVPTFAHIPLVNFNGEKMSKRKLPPLSADDIAKLKACGWTGDEIAGRDDLNIATVAYYRELGYLPAAIINYMCRLGWSMDGTSEIIPLPEMIANFSLERVTDAPGNLDPKKLFWVQGEYMKLVPTAEKVERSIPYLRRAKLVHGDLDARTRDVLTKVIDAAGDRIKLFSDVLAFAVPLLKDEIGYDPKAVEKGLTAPGAAALLRGFAPILTAADPFDAPTLDAALHEYCTAAGVKPNALVTPLRVAVTGSQVGFGLFDTLAILGQDAASKRVAAALALAGS